MFAARENTSERTRENPGEYVFLITARQLRRRRLGLPESGLAAAMVGEGGEEVRRGEEEKKKIQVLILLCAHNHLSPLARR